VGWHIEQLLALNYLLVVAVTSDDPIAESRVSTGFGQRVMRYGSGSERHTWGVLGQFPSQSSEHQARFIMGRIALSDNGVWRLKDRCKWPHHPRSAFWPTWIPHGFQSYCAAAQHTPTGRAVSKRIILFHDFVGCWCLGEYPPPPRVTMAQYLLVIVGPHDWGLSETLVTGEQLATHGALTLALVPGLAKRQQALRHISHLLLLFAARLAASNTCWPIAPRRPAEHVSNIHHSDHSCQ